MEKKKKKVIGTGWYFQPVPKGLPPYVSVEASLVPAGISNRYQWKPKAPVEKPGVLSRGQWSRLRGTGWETGDFGLSQPMPKTRFLVVHACIMRRSMSDQNLIKGKVYQQSKRLIIDRALHTREAIIMCNPSTAGAHAPERGRRRVGAGHHLHSPGGTGRR